MEVQLLDSTHGWNSDSYFCLEQWWLLDGADIAHIEINCHPERFGSSNAGVVVVEPGMPTGEGVLRLRSYPAQWWQRLNISYPNNELPPFLSGVAAELLERLVKFLEVINENMP